MAYIGIDANGVRYKFVKGSFTTGSEGVHSYVNIGFKPKTVYVISTTNLSDRFATAYYDEDSEINIGYFCTDIGHSDNSLLNIVDTGFAFTSPSTSFNHGTAYFIAIG